MPQPRETIPINAYVKSNRAAVLANLGHRKLVRVDTAAVNIGKMPYYFKRLKSYVFFKTWLVLLEKGDNGPKTGIWSKKSKIVKKV